MKIGLFFGSFNPVHMGHLIIANYVLQHSELSKIWMVLSPQSPFKKKESLARDYDRLHLLHLATETNDHIIPSSIEFGLPKPSYTIDTLTYLKEKHPDYQFSLIMGEDNLSGLPRWKNGEILMRDYEIFVYKRAKAKPTDFDLFENIHFLEAPLLDISASFIRKLIKENKSVQYMVPEPVFRYLQGSNLYKS